MTTWDALYFIEFILLFLRTGFTDLALQKEVNNGFPREQEVVMKAELSPNYPNGSTNLTVLKCPQGSCKDISQRELHECIRGNYRDKQHEWEMSIG